MFVNANNFHIATYVFDISPINDFYSRYMEHTNIMSNYQLEDSVIMYDHMVSVCANEVILELNPSALVVPLGYVHLSKLLVKDIGGFVKADIRNIFNNASFTPQEGCIYKFFVVGITLYMSAQHLTRPMRVRLS